MPLLFSSRRTFSRSVVLAFLGLMAPLIAAPEKPAAGVTPVMTDITAGLKVIDEIDTAEVAPVFESAAGASSVATILGRKARVVPPGEKSVAIAYILGKDKGIEPGRAYILAVEFPDDVSRAIYIANRGADYTRGWATGMAVGDVRSQFAEISPESLNYPQTGEWQQFKQYFHLLNRFQGVKSVRDHHSGDRPFLPKDGFHVVLFQVKKLNDPRSEGMAIGKIRLYEVPDPKALYATIHYPPDDLPRRHIFWREEMADQLIQTNEEEAQGVSDSIDWYRYKMKMSHVLGINTLAKDLLEFGFNQGWLTGDDNWVINAQPPNRDLWNRLVPAATDEGMDVMPYYEYKTGIGMTKDSLAKQRRAHKLYHGIKQTSGYKSNYSGVYWTEGHNGDVTDPDALEDAKRMMDKTVIELKKEGKFAGVWFRTRTTHLPMSFAEATIARFKEDNKGDEQAQATDQKALIASYEGDKALYNKYVDWWFRKRAQFLKSIQEYLADGLGQKDVQVLYTPWTGEAVPVLHSKDQYYGHPGVITDDPDWWKSFMNEVEDGWFKYHWSPSTYSQVMEERWYHWVLRERPPINHPSSWNSESFHGAPPADPENFKEIDNVMMTYPIGRLITTEDPALFAEYRQKSGLTVIKHYALNEEHLEENVEPSPFDHLVGYISVDCDRAGNHLMLQEARSVAFGDPRNIGYLSGSSFNCGFPEIMQRFNRAFLAVPALPSKRLEDASSDTDVVVRQIPTDGKGTYYYVVNTSMRRKENVKVSLSGKGAVTNLVTNEKENSDLTLTLDSAELRAYRVGP